MPTINQANKTKSKRKGRPPTYQNPQQFTITLDIKAKNRIEEIAHQLKKNRTAVIQDAVDFYLKSLD